MYHSLSLSLSLSSEDEKNDTVAAVLANCQRQRQKSSKFKNITELIIYLCSFFFLTIQGIQIDCNMGINTWATLHTSLNISVNFVCFHDVYDTTQT